MKIDCHIKRKTLIEKHSFKTEKELFFLECLHECIAVELPHYKQTIEYSKKKHIKYLIKGEPHTFRFQDGYLFKQYIEDKILFVDYTLWYIILCEQFEMSDIETDIFITHQIEKHLGLTDYEIRSTNYTSVKSLYH